MQVRYETRTRDMATVWHQLEQCHQRGIRILDDASGQFVFKSYSALYQEAGQLAAVLAAQGIGAGERVLLCAETTPNFPTLWLALLWIGAVPVPMPPAYALSGQYTFWERISGLLRHFNFYCCNPDEVEQISEIARVVDSPVKPLVLSTLYSQAQAGGHTVPPRVSHGDSDTAFVQYTSGSTKAPKGIMVNFGNLFANAAAMWQGVALDPEQHGFISWLPLYHDMGLVGMFLASLISQSALVLVSPQSFARRPLQFLGYADQFGSQYCSMPNFAYEWILKRAQGKNAGNFSMAQFRWMGVGAEPVNPATMQRFIETMRPFGLREGVVSPCYGLAEATLAVSLAEPFEGFRLSGPERAEMVTCGKPVAGMDIDTSDGRIRIKGESVAQMALVHGQPTPLADADGYYNTGDCGYLDQGLLVVQGRADEMFIINGENYYPYDIEAAAREVEGVLKRRAICFQLPAVGDSRAQTVLLYERLPVSISQEEQIEQALRAEVMRHTGLNLDIVQGVEPRSIPVTPSGKLQRLRARKQFQDGYFQAAPADAAAMDETARLITEPVSA